MPLPYALAKAVGKAAKSGAIKKTIADNKAASKMMKKGGKK